MNYKNYNDYELIYMVRENDDDIYYDILLEKYIPIIKSIAYHYYNSYSNYGYDREDFIQEGYCTFLNAVNKYNEEKNTLFYTFLIVCLHRSFITFCNKISNDKKNISNLYLVSIYDTDIKDESFNTEDYFLYRNNVKNIWDIIYRKPIEFISVFELRWNHFNYDEISSLLDLPNRTIKAMYRECLRFIREELKYN